MKSKQHSEAAMKWREEYVEKYPPVTEGKKQCTICGKLKYFNTEQRDISEFHIRKNQAYRMREAGLKNAVYLKPDSWCKTCKNAESNARRKRRWAEDPDREREIRKAKHKKYRENIGEERYLELKRLRSRKYRRLQGVGLDRDVDDRKDKSGIYVPVGPFVDWAIKVWPEGGFYQAVNGRISNPDKMGKIMRGAQTQVDLEWIDEVLTKFNGPHISTLYPEMYG